MRLLDLLLPPACAGCGRSAGTLFCTSCRQALRSPSTPAERFLTSDPSCVVGEQLALAMAAFAYEGPMRSGLASLKYGGARRVAGVLAALATPALAPLLAISGAAALVHVPVHRERLAARGYDQAALLTRHLGRRSGLPVCSSLVRVRPTTKQHRLDRAARLRNLRDAFAAAGAAPRTVILVDDIITTTATLEACAGVLRHAGAETVYGFAIAREV